MKYTKTALALLLLQLPATAFAADILIGVPQGLTGPVAYVGVPQTNGIKLAVEVVNNSGMLGNDKIKLQIEDTATDKTQAVAIVNRMVRDPNILLFLGPTSSGESLSVAPIANTFKVPMITSSSAPDIPKAGPFSFKTIPDPGPKEMGSLAVYAANKQKVTKCELVYDRSGDGYMAQAKAVREGLAKTDAKIVSEDSILGSDTEFTGLGTKLASLDIDCLFLATAPEPAAGVVVQARQAGMRDKVKIFTGQAAASPPWLELGGAAVEGSFMLTDIAPGGSNDEGKAFFKNYQERYGTPPTTYSAHGYNFIKLAAHAIKTAGPNPTREKVREALRQIKDVPSILGKGVFTFGEDRIGDYNLEVLTVRSGKFILAPN